MRNTVLAVLFLLFESAFTFKSQTVEPCIQTVKAGLLNPVNSYKSVLETVNNIDQVCDSFYKCIFYSGNRLNKKVFSYALKGYSRLLKKGMVTKKDTLTIIDYSLSANVKRLWVVDLRNQAVLFHELVAHGRNSGNEYARSFSNISNSYKTSLGFFLTGEIYCGKHETSLKLHGVESRFNGNAFDRGIVMHGADYVSESFIEENQRLGRSQGCPAVSEQVINDISSVISNGTCLFAYYPSKTYLKSSGLLK